MALVTPEELTTVLGIGDLYPPDRVQAACDAAIDLIEQYVTAESFSEEPEPMRKAALNLAVDLWQAELMPGGQQVGVDFTPAPFRFGRSLISKVQGLLGPYLDVEGMVG